MMVMVVVVVGGCWFGGDEDGRDSDGNGSGNGVVIVSEAVFRGGGVSGGDRSGSKAYWC